MSLNFNLGMTATAAASHGHEYSPSRDHNSNQAPSHHQQHHYHHSHSQTLPHLSIPTPDLSLSSLWTPISYLGSKLNAWSPFGSSAPQNDAKSVSPDTAIPENDDESVNASENLSISAADGLSKKDRKRSMPTYTHFQIAHPPPESKAHRVKRRPKVLLQLRLLSDLRSAEPAFEMLPALHFVSHLKRLPLVFRHKFAPEFDDVVVLQSPNRQGVPTTPGQRKPSIEAVEDPLDPANVVAVIHFQPKGLDGCMTEFQMGDGSVWSAYSVSRKGYEFKYIDKHGCESRARWWIKKQKSPSRAGTGETSSANEEQLFKFSIMSPNARRHPVIGSLQKSGERQKISIADHYTVPEEWSAPSTGEASKDVSAPRQAFLGGTTSKYNRGQTMPPGTVVATDDAMKALMLVSGMWVTFAEGWSELVQADSRQSTSTAEPGTPSRASLRGDLTKLNTRRHSLGATLIRRSASAAGTPRRESFEESDEHSVDANSQETNIARSNSHSLAARWRRRKSAHVQPLSTNTRKASELSVTHSLGTNMSYDVESPSIQSEVGMFGEASPEIIVSTPGKSTSALSLGRPSVASEGKEKDREDDSRSHVTGASEDVSVSVSAGSAANEEWEGRQREWGRSRRLSRFLGKLRGKEEK